MMELYNIKNYIFDFGGVLFEIDHLRTLKAFAKLSKNPTGFTPEKIAVFAVSPALIDIEKGKISPDEFRKRIRESMYLIADDLQIDNAWNKTLIGLYPDSVKIISAIKKLGNLVLMSNTNEIHYKHFEPQCKELFAIFDRKFYSHEVGMRKPDSEFFNYILKEMQFKPQETLFIDDSIANIVAAIELNIHTHIINKENTLSDLLHSVVGFPHKSST